MLTQQFHAYRMDRTDTVVQHIAKVQNMARRLLDLEETVSDLTMMAKILASLTSKYSHFQTAWDSVEPPRQTLEYLKERLIQEENRLGAESDEITALATTTRRAKKDGKSGDKKKNMNRLQSDKKEITCFLCREIGKI